MKKVDFSQSGGFPLTQDTLDFMQQGMQDVVRAFYAHLFLKSDGRYIISGVEQSGGGLTSGWAILEGELMYVASGQGEYLLATSSTQSVIFENNQLHGVYIDRYLQASQSPANAIHVSEFARVNGHRTISQSDCIQENGPRFNYELPELVTSLELNLDINHPDSGMGFLLNRIIPFQNIQNGHELFVRLGNRTGMTPIGNTNILYMNQKTIPVIGLDNFFGSQDAPSANAVIYDKNVHVLLRWSSASAAWIEVYRSGMANNV